MTPHARTAPRCGQDSPSLNQGIHGLVSCRPRQLPAGGRGDYQPDIRVNPPVWGRRTVVTSAIPAGKVLVGAFGAAKLFKKGGIRVESTNSNQDDFINDKITTRLRQREGLQVKYPAAFVYLDLTV